MLERDVEKEFIVLCKKEGWLSFKFESRTHDPDRIVLAPGGHAFLVEFKAPGMATPRPGQYARMQRLRDAGQKVGWFSDAHRAVIWIKNGLYQMSVV